MSGKRALGSQMETLIENLGGDPPENPVRSKYATAEQMERLIEAAGGGGGGGGGTSDYADLSNKPSINSVTLSGNKTAADLSLATASDVAAKEDKATEVTISTDGAVTQALDAGKIYHFTGALTALTITLNAPATGQLAHYHVDFNAGSTAPTVTIPASVTMPDSFTAEASKHYEVDILNNYGAVISWANS